MDRFDAMQIFVRVVEKGSFSAVAKERGIGQPAVSKRISALEDDLGTELIHRTSRSIALTEAGRDFYESASRIVNDFENATSRIGRSNGPVEGQVHRLKLIKRQMYGRASFDLLRLRVLHKA